MTARHATTRLRPAAFSGHARHARRPAYELAGIADIAVHLDGSGRDEAKIAHAEMIARAAEAHLTAFLANHIPLTPLPPGPGGAWIVSELWKNGEATGDEIEEKLRGRLSRVEASTEIRRYDDFLGGLEATAARLARSNDLFVFGRPYGDERHWPEFLESVLFDAGGTAFVVPPGAERPVTPRTIMVGWRDTPECAHAIAVALPFLKAAEQVHLVSVTEDGCDEERHREPAADMARHLARHGARVEVRHLPHWDAAGMGLLNEAGLLGAELIVVGAYGRSRLREWIWGGVTRDLLTHSTVPLLLRH